MLIIREMLETDLEQICQIEAETFSMPWSMDSFREMINCSWALYLVAEEEQQIVGGCGVRNIVGEGEITNVVIKEQFRKKGIGYLMMEELLKRGYEMGITEFTLEVRTGNKAAVLLYEKLGFQIEGVRKNYYEKPVEDGYIMWKREK